MWNTKNKGIEVNLTYILRIKSHVFWLIHTSKHFRECGLHRRRRNCPFPNPSRPETFIIKPVRFPTVCYFSPILGCFGSPMTLLPTRTPLPNSVLPPFKKKNPT